jgi:hypothetical protein
MMSNLWITLLIASIIILISLALLSISLIFTGKQRIRPGMCGKDPTKKKEECDKDKDNDDSCGLCNR